MANELVNYAPPGPLNVFVPGYSKKCQAALIQAFVLNQDQFKINKWHTATPVDTMAGVWPKFNTADMFRLPDTTGNSYEWPDGKPMNVYEGDANVHKSRRTNVRWDLKRYAFKDFLGKQTVNQSPIDEVARVQNELAMKCMVLRSYKLVTLATTSSNWTTGSYGTTADSGWPGNWGSGSISDQRIAKTFAKVVASIKKRSGGKVSANMLKFVISPDTAVYMSGLAEIRHSLTQQSGTLGVLKGSDPNIGEYLLPNPYAGIEIEIDDTIKVTAQPTVDLDTINFMFPVNVGLFVAKPGSIEVPWGGQAFSTFHCFQLSDGAMKPVTQDLGEASQGYHLQISDAYQFQLVSDETGYLFTQLDSSWT